jgi:N-acetylglutamate synthase-like GNAT family acetyltransferase
MKGFKIRELRFEDINRNILDDFNRYQDVERCYRNENGNWVLKDIKYIENWDKNEMDSIISDFINIIDENGYVFCAYKNEKIIGFAMLLNKPFVSRNQYIQLSNLQVSCEYRYKGIGKKLFELCIQKTKKSGLKKYIFQQIHQKKRKDFI